MSCHRHEHDGHGLDWQAIPRQDLLSFALRSHMDEPNYPDQESRNARHHEMHQENAFEFLSLQLPLPRENPRGDHRRGGNRRDQKVVVSRGHQRAVALPLAEKIKEHTDDEEGNREVDQHDVLRVLFALRVPPTLLAEARKAAESEGVALNRILARVGKGNPPVEGDELPQDLAVKKVKKK